jgi:hypothetical protein
MFLADFSPFFPDTTFPCENGRGDQLLAAMSTMKAFLLCAKPLSRLTVYLVS